MDDGIWQGLERLGMEQVERRTFVVWGERGDI
jgi:hypothetical protein